MDKIKFEDRPRTVTELIEMSIQKWRDILDGSGTDLGQRNCALCVNYRDRDYLPTKDGNPECIDCPVQMKTGIANCAKTPYFKWYFHHLIKHDSLPYKIQCDKCQELVQAELEFLEELLKSFKNNLDRV